MLQSRRYCEECGRYVLAARQPMNLVLHLLLTLLTWGLWLGVWMLIAVFRRAPWRCQRCGSVTRRDQPDDPPYRMFKRGKRCHHPDVCLFLRPS